MSLSCLVVEDQRPAQRVLVRYIGDLPHLELAGVCGTAFEAMAILHRRSVDLMFLDLNLPQLGGFDFLRSLQKPPKVIVTTAYSEHAVEGFDLNVVDYLVKPIAFDRFIRAIDRVKAAAEPEAPFTTIREDTTPEEVFVRSGGELRRLALRDIVFLKAEGDYVSIATSSGRLFVLGTLSRWEDRFGNAGFVRVHKSFVVNMTHVTRVTGSHINMGQQEAPIGRRYRAHFLTRLGR